MTNYVCKTTFGRFRFAANFADAASPIESLPDRTDEDSDGFSTPFQAADARHNPHEAARLLLQYFGRDYWCDPSVVDDGYAVDYTDDGKAKTKIFASDEEDDAQEFAAEHGSEVEEIETFDGMTKEQYLDSLIVSVEAEDDEQD